MKGDFTRDTFDLRKQFTRVLMQQGRVQLDADWNEQTSILLHYLQALASDIIGPHGGPTYNLGFGISVTNETAAGDFLIGPGVYYVDGIRCENEAQTSYGSQTDYPLREDDKLEEGLSPYLIYLDVWERHVTYHEGDGIREVALGGPDTTTRARVVHQVRAVPVDNTEPLDLDLIDKRVPPYPTEQRRALIEISLPILIVLARNETDLEEKKELETKVTALKEAQTLLNSERLRARAFVAQPSTDPCTISPDARYRGAENQLYRVEIHRSGGAWDGTQGTAKDAATFKWSRENGSVVFPIQALQGQIATLAHLGRDNRFGLNEGDWVEVVDDDYGAHNRAEELLFVKEIDRDTLKVTLDRAPASNVGQIANKHPLLRRWDHNGRDLTLDAGAALILEGAGNDENWLKLEHGVQVQFAEPPAGGEPNEYRTGDYWLIPARIATGDVDWPGPPDDPEALSPRGIKHSYAPLHKVTIAAGKVEVSPQNDLRLHFDPQAIK